jgi:hypothetical protein
MRSSSKSPIKKSYGGYTVSPVIVACGLPNLVILRISVLYFRVAAKAFYTSNPAPLFFYTTFDSDKYIEDTIQTRESTQVSSLGT